MHSHRDHWVGDQTSAVWLCFCLDSRLSKAVCMACACEMYFYCMPPVPKERQETSNPIWHKHSLWVAALLTLHLLVGKITPSYSFASAAGLICTALCSWLLILMFNLEVQCRAHGTEGQRRLNWMMRALTLWWSGGEQSMAQAAHLRSQNWPNAILGPFRDFA